MVSALLSKVIQDVSNEDGRFFGLQESQTHHHTQANLLTLRHLQLGNHLDG